MGFFTWFRKTPAPAPGRDIVLPPDLHPVQATTPSERCIAFIKKTEGLMLLSKPDVDGVYVNGYGCKIIDGQPAFKGQVITEAIADRSCRAHAQLCANAVLAMVGNRSLRQGQLDALVDFVYNAGS